MGEKWRWGTRRCSNPQPQQKRLFALLGRPSVRSKISFIAFLSPASAISTRRSTSLCTSLARRGTLYFGSAINSDISRRVIKRPRGYQFPTLPMAFLLPIGAPRLDVLLTGKLLFALAIVLSRLVYPTCTHLLSVTQNGLKMPDHS